jgi:hypothetical protein
MATTKITDLTAYTDPVNTDVLPIVDVTSDVTKKVSIANLMKNASLGTAAAPSIAFDGDPDSGLFSPGANQVAVATNGTGRLFVDASGNVGFMWRNWLESEGYAHWSYPPSEDELIQRVRAALAETGAIAALDDLYANNNEGMKRLADS